MPRWEGSNRQHTLPADWSTTVKRIMQRDHHRCQWIREDTGRRCGRHADGGIDHIIRPADGGTEQDSNLRALCTFHHNRKTGNEGGTASGRARRLKRDANTPLHPGLLPATQAKPPYRNTTDPAPF